VDVGDLTDFGFVIQEHLCVFVDAPVDTSPTLMTVHSDIAGVEGADVSVSKIQ
jgi:hypothetical protein